MLTADLVASTSAAMAQQNSDIILATSIGPYRGSGLCLKHAA